jgi:4-amino-4-deoxy-L-arabinose transferase-like glycosyltransferase
MILLNRLQAELTPASWLFPALVAVCLLRGLTLDFPALLDPTEGRYAFIAQQMTFDNDWVTPHLPIDGKVVPYLGKPPLHFWLTASVFSAFGFADWAARIPSFLSFVFLCWCVWSVAKSICTREVGLAATLIFASTALGFFFSGASIVDFTLAACVGGALTAFTHFAVATGSSRRFCPGLMVFVATTFGFMTKGPVAVVLAAIPILGWSAATRDLRWTQSLPWKAGVGFFLAVTVPWFYLSEQANPGFLKYFFLQENLGRFLHADYGDRYGTGHMKPYGSIWMLYAIGCLPWTPLLAGELFTRRGELKSLDLKGRASLVYLLLWAVAPLVMFTFARQLLITYAIPGLAGFSLVAAAFLSGDEASLRLRAWLTRGVYLALVAALVLSTAYLALGYDPHVAAMVYFPLVCLFAMPVLLYRNPDTPQVNVLAAFAVSFVSLFAFALVLLEAPVSERFSAKPILRCLTKYTTSALSSVGVLGNRSHSSSYFYGRSDTLELERNLKIVPLESLSLADAVPKDLIIPRREGGAVKEQVPADYSLVLTLGSWSWVSSRGVRLDPRFCPTYEGQSD